MARLGRRSFSPRRWLAVAVVAIAGVVLSLGTPKAGCGGGATDEDPALEAEAAALEEVDHLPPSRDGFRPERLYPIDASTFCPTAGRVAPVGAQALRVRTSGMRGVVASDGSRSVELAFVFRGASADAVPLANGEMRQQIGVKLRAQDTCNVVYVMWHLAPKPGIGVSIKSNPGLSTHAACGDRGYTTIRATGPTSLAPLPALRTGEAHTLRADLDGDVLRVHADGAEVWRGTLPRTAFAFDGPVGVRSDNGDFAFELRVPEGGKRTAKCVGAMTEQAH